MTSFCFITQSLSRIIHLVSIFSFSFLIFFSLLSKNKNKNLFSLLVYRLHLLFYFLQHFPSLFAFLFHHYSLLYHYTSSIIFFFLYFDNLLLILFCLNLILFLSFNLYFSHTKIVSTLSLSLHFILVNFCYFLQLSLRLIFLMRFGIVLF